MLKWAEAHTVQANSAMQVESSQTDVSKSLAHKVAASRDILPCDDDLRIPRLHPDSGHTGQSFAQLESPTLILATICR